MAYLKLIRYKNLIMILLTLIFIRAFIIRDTWYQLEFIFFCLATLLLTASGYAFNDVLDIKTDAINKPTDYVVRRLIPLKHAKFCAVFLFVIGLIIGIYVSFRIGKLSHILLILVPFVLVLIYSLFLKRVALVGNLVMALCALWIYPLVFLFFRAPSSYESLLEAFVGMFDEIFITVTLFIYGLFSFLITLIREIAKDIQDRDGDYNQGMKTLPILLGTKRSRNIVIALSFLFVLACGLLCHLLFMDESYFLGVYVLMTILLPFTYTIYFGWTAASKQEFAYLSRLYKLIMLFGLFSMPLLNSY